MFYSDVPFLLSSVFISSTSLFKRQSIFYIVSSLFGQNPSIFCIPGLCLHINYYVVFIIYLVAVIQLHKQNLHFDFQNTLPFFVHVFFLYNFVFFSRWIKANSTVLHKYHVYCVQFSFIYLQSTTVEYVNYVCICY